jgi:hypothetical protein
MLLSVSEVGRGGDVWSLEFNAMQTFRCVMKESSTWFEIKLCSYSVDLTSKPALKRISGRDKHVAGFPY